MALMDDSAHGFLDKSGKFHDRAQAATALGLKEPLQSHVLEGLKANPKPQFSPAAPPDSDQVKSATDNTGAYSAANPDIQYSPRGLKQAADEAAKLPRAKEGTPAKEGLPYAVGPASIPVMHLSTDAGLKTIDPAHFGKGRANRNDLAGGKKAYFFVAGSKMHGDAPLFGQGGYHAYIGEIPGTQLYDLRRGKPDPLGWSAEHTINREVADDKVKKAGYSGILIGGDDGRETVLSFKPVDVKSAGPFKGNKAVHHPILPKEQPVTGARLWPNLRVPARSRMPWLNLGGLL